MRAPAPSFSPINGAPIFAARSITLQIFSAKAPDRLPPKTVKSCAKQKTWRPVDLAVAGDDAVAEDLLLLHPEVGAAVRHELVDLDEAAGIEEQLDALARGELARGVLALDAGGAAAEHRLLVHLLELLDLFFDGHRTGILAAGDGVTCQRFASTPTVCSSRWAYSTPSTLRRATPLSIAAWATAGAT